MSEDERRRATDPLIVEMHGMLQRQDQKLDDTQKWMREIHAQHAARLDDYDKRLKPVEDFHGSAKTAGKVVAVVATPAALGIGAAIWVWFKGIIFHSKVAP